MTAFPMNPPLLQDLRALRARHLEQRAPAGLDEIERERDAFLLSPGMGSAYYITSAGEVLADDKHFWGDRGVYVPDEDEAIAALVIGARKMEIVALLELIPEPPLSAQVCPSCKGTRWITLHPQLRGRVVCVACNGRGWVDERLLARVESMRRDV